MNGQSTMRPKGGGSALVNRLVVKLTIETASHVCAKINWRECPAYSNRMFNEIKLITLPNKSS